MWEGECGGRELGGKDVVISQTGQSLGFLGDSGLLHFHMPASRTDAGSLLLGRVLLLAPQQGNWKVQPIYTVVEVMSGSCDQNSCQDFMINREHVSEATTHFQDSSDSRMSL